MVFAYLYFNQINKNSAKLPKMTNKKPLLSYQKQRLEHAIDAVSTPIFST